MMNEQKNTGNEDIYERFAKSIISSSCNQNVIQHFSKLPNIVEKVDFIIELLSKHNIAPKYIKDCKNNRKSSDLRTEGNKLFSLKRDEEALEKYTYSIALAENGSENLGLAYANRSAVLFRHGFFKECLIDIERALENNYPNSLKPKIIDRREKALNLRSKQKNIEYHQPIPTIEHKNPLIECASDCVEIKEDSEQGRFIVATRDISIGEVIAVESPTFAILTDMQWCHCHHCLTLCYNLIPCESCTKALFCSSTCKNNSISYHKYECPILATVESLDYNSCRLLPLHVGITMRDQSETELEESDSQYKSGRYKEINELVTNEMHRQPRDLFERATCTAFFYELLKNHTNFFEDNQNFKNTFVQLVFQHLQTMACNFHNICELCRNSSGIYESVQIGAGAYNFMSLFNHSCNPNVCRTSYGSHLCISAIQTIKKGEQLFDNYGFHYGVHPKSERQAALKKQYHFDCVCQACTNNWGTCHNLRNVNEGYKWMISFMNHHDDLADANLEVARKIRSDVIDALKKLEKDIPCYEFCLVQEILKQCDGIFGNVRRSLE